MSNRVSAVNRIGRRNEMSKPIFKMSLVRPTEAWYALSPEEKKALAAKSWANNAAVGAKMLVQCDATWSNGEWSMFQVEEFPDMEAVQKHRELQNSINYSRYANQKILLGTEMPTT
jgi:hypothetical protein